MNCKSIILSRGSQNKNNPPKQTKKPSKQQHGIWLYLCEFVEMAQL